jgi:NAD(P)-dependent dehydrogenase (short-subunit alcohol dehydrogenase family)
LKTYIVTGANRGLGLAIARSLASGTDHRVVLAVRDLEKGREVARSLGARVEATRLDCSSLAEVRRFAETWGDPVAGLVNNAGVQNVGPIRRSAEGFEETIAVNHLAAVQLTLGLLDRLRGGRVLFIGSGTHNPENRTATMFGFRGARFSSVAALARGEMDAPSDRQRGMDRYATSKLLVTVAAMELARRIPPERTAFFTLDPGMMAGTGLARTAPALARLAWAKLLPALARFLPDTSTPVRSGATAAWLLTDPGVASRSGEVFSFDRLPSSRVWDRARDLELGRRVLDETLALLDLPAFASGAAA